MRHLKKGRKFSRKKGQRRAFLKSLAENLIRHGKILTTEERAKELRSLIERLVTHAKKKNLAGFRIISQRLTKDSAYKLYHEIAPRYAGRGGGYTRIIKSGKRRQNDGAKMAYIEFVQ